MNKNKIRFSGMSPICGLLFLLLLCVGTALYASGPKLFRARVGMGLSPRIQANSWGMMTVYVENPDGRPRAIRLRMMNDQGGALAQSTVNLVEFTIPARVGMEYRSLVTVEESEQYRLEAFVDGIQLPGTESILLKLLSGRIEQIPIVNDDYDLSLGAFIQRDEFKESYKTTYFQARDLPDSWLLFESCPFIIFMIPNFDNCTDMQFRAILDYVRNGGRVIFAHPQGIVNAAASPLAELLPVQPLRFREIAELPSLKTAYPDAGEWVETSHPFLESLPVGDGVTTVAEGDFPVFRWRRYGLGECRAAMVPINDGCLNPLGIWEQVLGDFLSHRVMYANPQESEKCLQEMTGFKVPPPTVIRKIFLLYFLVLAVIMSLGCWFRKSSFAWLSAAAVALLITIIVLKSATGGVAAQAQAMLAGLETRIYGSGSGVLQGAYGFFSPSDGRVSFLQAQYHAQHFHSVPPPSAAFRLGGFGMPGFGNQERGRSQPIEVLSIDGKSEITELNVSANSSRIFALSGSIPGTENKFPMPELHYGAEKPEFIPWEIPNEISKPEAAWVLYPNGVRSLRLEGNRLVPVRGDASFHTDEIVNAVQDYLQAACRKPGPSLVLMNRAENPVFKLSVEADFNGRELQFIPLTSVFPVDSEINIPPEDIVLIAGDSSTRMMMAGNNLRSDGSSAQMLNDYTFRLQLPPITAMLETQSLELDFSYVNQGGNIEVKPVLVKPLPENEDTERTRKRGRGKSSKSVQETILAGRETRPGYFVFDNIDEPMLADGPLLRLQVRAKNPNLPPAEKMRANQWAVSKLKISLTCRLPEGQKEIRF